MALAVMLPRIASLCCEPRETVPGESSQCRRDRGRPSRCRQPFPSDEALHCVLVPFCDDGAVVALAATQSSASRCCACPAMWRRRLEEAFRPAFTCFEAAVARTSLSDGEACSVCWPQRILAPRDTYVVMRQSRSAAQRRAPREGNPGEWELLRERLVIRQQARALAAATGCQEAEGPLHDLVIQDAAHLACMEAVDFDAIKRLALRWGMASLVTKLEETMMHNVADASELFSFPEEFLEDIGFDPSDTADLDRLSKLTFDMIVQWWAEMPSPRLAIHSSCT
eukprot:TRINITY_DN47029_c0_g1_i1.p1 TRINITY_DN47029_c0_g1~~TRINITY_DN47029_c0_g1_i1.p1  ORF type:complete len:282 (-),score=36.77 TRINITY_DN47029_c0_g1_i1:89-934(-)